MIPIEEGSVFAGKYRLERALARGGMGSVWVARHVQLDVPLAIKFMDSGVRRASPGGAVGRFSEREAKAAAKLQSPHVVQVHDYGVEDGTPYIAMELLVGEDLGDRLKRERRLSLTATAAIVTQTAKALRRAHEQGIVHRDLKPGNIFLSKHQDDEVVKVLDFGIAKAILSAEGETTKTGTLVGSPHYMSPEQCRSGKNLDHRSDIWSLAVIVFKAITGQLPFPGDELGEVFMAICADPIPSPSQIAPDLGPEVDRFFVRGLARDMSKRYQSAPEFAEAFAAVERGRDRAELDDPDDRDRERDSPPDDRSASADRISVRPPPAVAPPLASEDSQNKADAALFDRSGSLAPAGATINGPPKGGSRTAILVAALVVGVLGVGRARGFFTMSSSETPESRAAATSPPDTAADPSRRRRRPRR